MGAEEMLEEDAREDWIRRGFAMKDFSMKKMTDIWDQDEQDELSREKKVKLIQLKHKPLTEDIKHVMSKVHAEVVKTTAGLKESIREFEPTILRNRRWLREHIALVHQMDEESTKYKNLKLQSHALFIKTSKVEKIKNDERHQRIEHKAPLLRRLRQMKDEADQSDRAKAEQKLEAKWKMWRDQELEVKKQQDLLAQEESGQRIAYKRRMNMKYWKAKLKLDREDAEQFPNRLEQTRRVEILRDVQDVVKEINMVDLAEAENNTYGSHRLPTMSGLGVFGIPVEPGEFYSLEDGGFKPELDNHTIAFPTSGPFDMENEQKRVNLMDAQSKVTVAKETLERLCVQKSNAMDGKKTITEKKVIVIRSLNQAKDDHRERLRVLAGPPRREPGETDRLYIHSLMKLQSDLNSELKELSIRERLLDEKLAAWSREETTWRDRLDAEQERLRILEAKVDEIDRSQNDLPMVIGRSIGHTNQAMDETLDGADSFLPKERFDLVTQLSKFELMKAASNPVFQLYEDARRLGIESWKMSKQKIVNEAELELTIKRLSKIKDSLTKQQSLNQRSDVVNALEKFYNNNEQLINVKKVTNGPLNWWKTSDTTTSIAVSQANGASVALDEDNRRGVLRGTCLLPSHTLWKLKFQIDVFNHNHVDASSFSQEDKIKVSFGTTSGSMSQIGVFPALDDAGNLAPGYTISHEYVGTRLYYCFEFFRSYIGMKSKQRQVLLDGSFEEDSSAEANQHAVNSGQHVLSDYVKMLRVQSQQGNQRIALLLEELVKVEGSSADSWDSKVLHGHSQRFPRISYSIQLREAIQTEVSKAIQHDIDRRRSAYKDGLKGRTVQDDTQGKDEYLESESPPPTRAQAVERQKRLEQSILSYRHRKSEHIEEATEAARDIVGQRLELFHSDQEAWIAGIVTSIRVEWKEGGTKLEISHLVKFQSSSGHFHRERWLDLKTEKYVLVAGDFAPIILREREITIEQEKMAEAESQAKKFQATAQSFLETEQEYLTLYSQEDRTFERAKERDVLRREKIVWHDAQRTCTYDPQVISMLELEARRQIQNVNNTSLSYEAALRVLKENYIRQTVQSKIEFIKKTWDRKNRRRLEHRKREREERRMKYEQSNQQVQEMSKKEKNEKELLLKQRMAEEESHTLATALKAALQIPNFELAVAPAPPCSHRILKAWGSTYEKGQRCKQCGKEMSRTFEETDVARGADPQLDRDVEKHRLNESSFHFENAAHLKRVEDERIRLEKEAREIQLNEVQSYDSTHIKAIEALNFRHFIDRNVDDSNMTRNDKDRHLAAYRDGLSFFARVNQYRYRLQILFDMRGAAYKQRLIELDALDDLQMERDMMENTIVVVQVEQERARQLLKNRKDSIAVYKESAKHLQECLVEKTLALRAREGVEDDAKLAMLHALALERTTAKMQLIWDNAFSYRQHVKENVRTCKLNLEDAVKHRQSLEERLLAWFYRKKGTQVKTRFGVGHVHMYREADSFLIIRLKNWKATHQESRTMEAAEKETRLFVLHERAAEKYETKIMQEEEKMCLEIAKWAVNNAKQQHEIQEAVVKCELKTQVHLAMKTTKILFRKQAELDAHRAHRAKLRISRPKLKSQSKRRTIGRSPIKSASQITQIEQSKESVPENQPKLKKQTTFERKRISRAALKRLVMAHAEAEILKTENAIIKNYDEAKFEGILSEVSSSCVSALLQDILKIIAQETLEEGLSVAKLLEYQSTMVNSRQFPSMQPHVHVLLQRQAMAYKSQLEIIIRTWSRQTHRLRCIQTELARRREIERLAEEERKRLEMLCKEMSREELLTRKFYREEKRLMMIETRNMQLAEVEMREYMRQLELQQMMEKYNSLDLDDSRESSMQARRLQIKKGKREKHRLAEEWASIKQEDELALAIREIHLQDRREREYEQQQLEFMLQQAEFQESEDEDEGKFVENDDEVCEPNDEEKVATQVRQLLERLDPKARVKLEKQIERRAKAKMEAAKKRKEFVHRLNEEYMIAVSETMLAVADADLKVVHFREQLSFLQRLYADMEQVKLMQVDLKNNLKQTKEITEGARKKQEYAAACIARCKAAEEALEFAISREKRDEKHMLKTIKDTEYMDSYILHNRCQRFLTDFLAKALHRKYFQSLVHLVMIRAMTVSAERRLLSIGERIQSLDQETAEKSVQVTRLWRQHTRASRMRLFRSELGKTFFRKHRRIVLKTAFHGWLKVWHQTTIVRHAYELRYSLARQDQKLVALEKMHETGSHLNASSEASPKQTLLKKFQHRWIQCRLCKTMYSEAQNNRFACVYHPGQYERACVRSCPSRSGEPMQSNCMLHRAMRWLCCDETEEGAFGSTGCKRRFHLPVRNDPPTQENLRIAEENEKAKLDDINEKLSDLQRKNISHTVYQTLRDQLQQIQDDLSSQRDKVSRYNLYHKY
ncbi:hypothetical protein AeRB84_005482 [Aphanomyces euteiches]|nr:hypothetical protein AeRB84_007753 [Aphanomyces euteiches]KAH9149064.1 hypothetical protein AeRB84_007760 [Aphanomyces euteiches]KAH9152059.1 hypothetical protein AeRB84_005482 [Aphanomyces euteiches]